MSEDKPGLPYSRESHPHTGDPRVDPEARDLTPNNGKASSVAQKRRKMEQKTMGPYGFFPEEPSVIAPEVAGATPTHTETPLRERALLFNEGMPMFRVSYDPISDELIIPRTWEQANQLFLGRLPASGELAISKSCLEKGKKGDTVIKRVGKSRFGAFTIAYYPTVDENGRSVDIPILADMRQRSRAQNLVDRFRIETSTLSYYAKSPRFAAKRR